MPAPLVGPLPPLRRRPVITSPQLAAITGLTRPRVDQGPAPPL